MELQRNPFADKDKNKVYIAAEMDYAQSNRTDYAQLKLRCVRATDGKDTEQTNRMRTIANFLTNTKWRLADPNTQGITWLELFIWFKMHGPGSTGTWSRGRGEADTIFL